MNQPPLNPDALDKAALAMCHYVVANREMGHGIRPVYHQYQSAKAAVSAYLAVAQPEVNSVEELDALPTGTVVRDSDGDVWERWIRSWKTIGVIHEFVGAEAIILPASVLYCPEENDD